MAVTDIRAIKVDNEQWISSWQVRIVAVARDITIERLHAKDELGQRRWDGESIAVSQQVTNRILLACGNTTPTRMIEKATDESAKPVFPLLRRLIRMKLLKSYSRAIFRKDQPPSGDGGCARLTSVYRQ